MRETHLPPQAILFIASRSTIGGGEVNLLDVLQWLDRARFTPLVALPQPGPFHKKLADLGVETFTLGVDYGWLKPPEPWYGFLTGYGPRVRRLVAFIQRRGVALVHTNSNQLFEGAVAARLAGVHHVHVVHIPFPVHLPIWQRVPIEAATFASWVDELSSAIVAVAEPVAESFSPPADRGKIRVIHNGLNLDRYRDSRAAGDGRVRRELGIPEGAVLVTGVGRLHPDKVRILHRHLREVPGLWAAIDRGNVRLRLARLHTAMSRNCIGRRDRYVAFRHLTAAAFHSPQIAIDLGLPPELANRLRWYGRKHGFGNWR